MAHSSTPTIVDRRQFGQLIQLQINAPELAGGARPGQFLLLQAAPAGFHDPFLRRPLFIAGADPAAHVLSLILPQTEPGLGWLAERRPGDQVCAFGPVGNGFADPLPGSNVLLAGSGVALPALLFLLSRALERNASVELIAIAESHDLLPPPYLLPAEPGYQASAGPVAGLVDLMSPPLISWADHIAVTGPELLLPDISARIRSNRLQWPAGFAEVALGGSMPCGMGACRSCLVRTRHGLRSRCRDGPVFDLRDMMG